MSLEVESRTFFHSVATVGNRCPFERRFGIPDAEKLQIMDVEVDLAGQWPLTPMS